MLGESMIMDLILFIVVTALVLNTVSVLSLPTGSPVCTVGSAAPQDLHLERSVIITGPIPSRQYQVKVGTIILDSTTINQIPPNIELTVEVSALSSLQFRGVLVVVNNDVLNLSSNLKPTSSSVKSQDSCPGAGRSGFTHVDNQLKSSVQGSLLLESSRNAFLDVNIVISNRQYTSEYYYTRFEVSTVAQSPPTAPVPNPNPLPVPIPIPIPIPVPVPIPAAVPLPRPVPVPAPMPIPLPVPVPAFLPILQPLPLPQQVPVSAPLPVEVPVPIPGPLPTPTPKPCGLFGLSILCFGSGQCGFFRRLLGIGGC